MSFFDELKKQLATKELTVKVAWVGLDGAGKTTLLKRLTEGIFKDGMNRTLGMNIEEFKNEGVRFVCWDIGGQISFREALWKTYIAGSMGLVFVVDSANKERFNEAKGSIWDNVIPTLPNELPILIIANKQDKTDAKTVGEIIRKLDLSKLENPFAVVPASAKTGFNVDIAFEWLNKRITEQIELLK